MFYHQGTPWIIIKYFQLEPPIWRSKIWYLEIENYLYSYLAYPILKIWELHWDVKFSSSEQNSGHKIQMWLVFLMSLWNLSRKPLFMARDGHVQPYLDELVIFSSFHFNPLFFDKIPQYWQYEIYANDSFFCSLEKSSKNFSVAKIYLFISFFNVNS